MVPPSVLEHRRQRFAELLAHPDFNGSQAALGRVLGWKNGAMVWQILNKRRPVSEDLVFTVHTMRGGRYAGWFTEPAEPQSTAAREHEEVTANDWPLGRLITPERWRSLDPQTRAAAIAAAEAAVMESLIGSAASGKQRSNGA